MSSLIKIVVGDLEFTVGCMSSLIGMFVGDGILVIWDLGFGIWSWVLGQKDTTLGS